MLRKRYLVVVVGRGGLAEAHRSEISRHRSEREALAAAEEEREHLGVMHGDRAGIYRVVVERDGVPLEDEPARVLTHAAEPFPAGPPEPVAEHVRVLRRHPPQRVEAPEAPGAVEEHHDTQEIPLHGPPEGNAGAEAPDAPEEPPAPPRPDRGREPRPRMPALDDIPSGPVPDDVLRRFEEAIAREDRRNARTPIEERARADRD